MAAVSSSYANNNAASSTPKGGPRPAGPRASRRSSMPTNLSAITTNHIAPPPPHHVRSNRRQPRLPTTTKATTTKPPRSKSSSSGITTATATATTQQQQQQQRKRWQQLQQPPATSLPLMAVLQLLQPPALGDSVYLMDREYVQNWLCWVWNQQVPKNETPRFKEAIQWACLKSQLALPTSIMPDESDQSSSSYTNPGPIDNRALCAADEHPLLLSSWVQILDTDQYYSNSSQNLILPQRTQSLTSTRSLEDHDVRYAEESIIYCIAVPESFYETLRQIHGVVCDDFQTVSFQNYQEYRQILHHHQKKNLSQQMQPQQLQPQQDAEDVISTTTAKTNNVTNGHHHNQNNAVAAFTTTTSEPRPIEFRRKIIRQQHHMDEDEEATNNTDDGNNNDHLNHHHHHGVHSHRSLMDKLLLEQTEQTTVVLAVEVHPVKLLYTVERNHLNHQHYQNHQQTQQQGFCLLSRETTVFDALVALTKVVSPKSASSHLRVWSRWDYSYAGDANKNGNQKVPTKAFDSFELVHLEHLQEKKPGDGNLLTVQEWVEQHKPTNNNKRNSNSTTTMELELLLETRQSVNMDWPRATLELENRLQPGDLVDAQDIAGKWYEAVVKRVHDEMVEIHYVGWASRWDSKARRFSKLAPPEGVPSKVSAPAPLWSRSGRWRESLKEGDSIEVRDSSSIVERPKWYKGIVKKVGGPKDKPHELKGGASLEYYDTVGSGKEKLLFVLGRKQQILVEVEQEKNDKITVEMETATAGGDSLSNSTITAHPPYLRWVNLYGEEICKTGTHLKETKDAGPVTLRYEVDGSRKPVEVMKSHPMHGSGFMRESLRGMPPAPGSVGLHNLGNSCFLNSIVQCLNHIEPLTQYFLHDKYSKDLNKRNPLGSGGNVAVAYASLLKKMWAGNHSVLVPRLLKQTVANFAPQFDNSYQHDSHEFCQFLMDGLHEDLNRVKKKPYVEELEGFGMKDDKAAIESWRKHLLRHDSVVVDHCQGMHRSHLTCPQCGRESIKFDVYSSISLPLPTDKDTSIIKLEDCVEKFMEAEQLDERDAYYCPNCRRHVCALKLIALWSVPDILIFHLKRFTFDTCMLSGGMLRSKVDNTVEFPINGLDLTKEVLGPIDPDAPPIYNLFGVSEHSGPTANSGHYTATVRNSVDGQWYRCNDSHVGLTSGEASITGGAYLLFYQRAKGRTKWAGMHKVMKERNIDPYGGMEPTDAEGFKQVKTKKKKKSSG